MIEATDDHNCTNCVFAFRQQKTDQNGSPEVGMYVYSCRRHPPTAVLVYNSPTSGALVSMFPPVDKTMLCEEHVHDRAGTDPGAAS